MAATVERMPPPASRISRYPAPRWRRRSSPSREPANTRWVWGSTSPGVTRPPLASSRANRESGKSLPLQTGLDLGPRSHRHDPLAPGRHDRGIGRIRSPDLDRVQDGEVPLARPGPDTAGHRHHRTRPDDEQAGRRALGQAPLDEPEAHDRCAAGGCQPQFERLERREVAQPEVARRRREAIVRGCAGRGSGPVRYGEERRQRRQADELRLHDLDAGRTGLGLDGLPDPPDRGHREVEEVHRDLGAVRIVEPEAVGLDPGEAAAGFAHRPGDPPRELDIGRGEVDVVGDEERTGTDRDRAGGGVGSSRAEVRSTVRIVGDLRLQSLVLAAPDVGQLLSVGPGGRPRVQVDGEAEPVGQARSERPGERDAFVHRRLAERDERDDVDGADPGVLAGLALHVDGLDRDRHGCLESLGHTGRAAGEGEDAPVVTGVARPVEEVDVGRGRDRRGEPVDDLEPAALAEVRHGFDELRHVAIVTLRPGRRGPETRPWVRRASSRAAVA